MNVKLSEKAVLYRINNKDKKEINEPIGAYIKRERVAQGLNQDFVCKDICSVSYYSRIENNIIHPSNDYIEKIYKKLNKPVPKDLSNKKSKEQINNFLLAIEYRNENLIEVEFEKIKNNQNINNELYHFVYHTYHKNIDKLEHYIQILHKQQANFDDDELIIYLENLASYYLTIHDYKKAESFICYAINLVDSTAIEKPNILYRYAWVLGKLNNDLKCIYYAEEANKLFIKNHNIYRSVQCKLLIAIKLSNYFPEKSITIYEEIINITHQTNFEELNKISKFNLALNYKKYYHYEKSENLFNNLINNYQNDRDFIYDIYIELIDLLLDNNQKEKAIDYYNYIKNEPLFINNEFYNKYFYCKLFEKDYKLIVSLYKKEFIPYCIENDNFEMEIRCRNELVNLLEESNSYIDCINEYKNIISLLDFNKKNQGGKK